MCVCFVHSAGHTPAGCMDHTRAFFVRCLPFRDCAQVHFIGVPSQWGAKGHKVKVFVNGAAEPSDVLDMTLPASGPLGQCSFGFGRDKPEARQLRGVDFQDGCNTLRFVYTPPPPESNGVVPGASVGLGKRPTGPSTTTAYFIECKLYVWQPTDKVVVTDIDGTLTTTDFMGHIKTVRLANYQYAHKGACGFFSSLAGYGFKVYYLTARPITWINETRAFLANVRQDGMALPPGPVCCSTHHTAEKLVRSLFGIEYSDRIKTRFLNALHDVFARSGRDYTRYGRPLIAGFGNSRTDACAYKNAHIPFRFNINKKSVMTMEVEAAKVSGSGRSSRDRAASGGSKHGGGGGSGSKLRDGLSNGGPAGSSRSGSLDHAEGEARAASNNNNNHHHHPSSASRRRSVQRLKLSEWNVLQDTDAFFGCNAYDMSASDIEKCRLTCERMGFGGFAVFNGRAYFRKQSPASCFEARRRLARCSFHLAPLFESEIEDINSRYARDGEALVLTEESQSDAQSESEGSDASVAGRNASANATTDGRGHLSGSAAGLGSGSGSGGQGAMMSMGVGGVGGISVAGPLMSSLPAAGGVLASLSLSSTSSSPARDEERPHRPLDAEQPAGDEENDDAHDDDALDPHDALSKIEVHVGPFGDHVAAAATAAEEEEDYDDDDEESWSDAEASVPVETPTKSQAARRGSNSSTPNSSRSNVGETDGECSEDADADEDTAEAVASAAAAAQPHRTNRPSAESLTTRMFNTVKSLIPQFINLLSSPVRDDVDTALAGLQQLKVSEGQSIAKLEQLQLLQEQRRTQAAIAAVRKLRGSTNSKPAAQAPACAPSAAAPPLDREHQPGASTSDAPSSEPSGQDAEGADAHPVTAEDTGMTTSEQLASTTKSKLVSSAPVVAEKPSPGVSTSAFLSFFTNGLGTVSTAAATAKTAAEQPSFNSFEDPKLHLILDIMSVQRAR
jgi:hypothetical protein